MKSALELLGWTLTTIGIILLLFSMFIIKVSLLKQTLVSGIIILFFGVVIVYLKRMK